MDDQRLLREFTERRSQGAFSELTRRYLRLVYSTCLRELGDVEAAQDATQVVFLLLARKARSLRGRAHLPGWLFHTARLVSKNLRKQERRRAEREQTVMRGMLEDEGGAAEWQSVDPYLNDALSSLKALDRDAVLLRFFEGCTLSEVGSQLGVSEEGARKRVDRALDKMRGYFTRHGIAAPSAALALLLSAHAAKAVPMDCVRSVQALSVPAASGAAVSSYAGAKIAHLTQGVIQVMTMTTFKTAAVVLVLAGAGVGGFWQIASGAQAASKGPIIAVSGPVPKIVQQAVHSAYAGDFSSLNSSLAPEMKSVLTKDAVSGTSAQLKALGSIKDTSLVSRQAMDDSEEYRFTIHAVLGTAEGRLDQTSDGKISLFELTPGAISPVTSPQALLDQAVALTVAGDAAALRAKSTPQMANLLTPDAVSSIQSQLRAFGSITKVTIDQKTNAGGAITAQFHIDFTSGQATGTLTEDAQSRIAGLEFHLAL
ncbi:hypothetical protein CCAX7_20610 [Capsulimonas corticalis]|uniref:Uncharacterized protein n=1 Tax=Capsulimonas corticalis TaxID=2219043 RepID=A0A402D2G5_9BACT|nr:sigma-70 family RNA polymerase sigma factor [Capsulimonas corticalis]BDI30010.1 hypothetical protein CCAX7_20610 [Capsulimonas corticalis]